MSKLHCSPPVLVSIQPPSLQPAALRFSTSLPTRRLAHLLLLVHKYPIVCALQQPWVCLGLLVTSSCSSISMHSFASPSVPHKGAISFSHVFVLLFEPPLPPAAPVQLNPPVCPLLGMLLFLSSATAACGALDCFPLVLLAFLPEGLALVLFLCSPGQGRPLVVIVFPVACLELGFTVGSPCGLSAYILNCLSGSPFWGPSCSRSRGLDCALRLAVCSKTSSTSH